MLPGLAALLRSLGVSISKRQLPGVSVSLVDANETLGNAC